MVINMNETRLCTIEQIRQFLGASAAIAFSAVGDDSERYVHISQVLKRFDYPRPLTLRETDPPSAQKADPPGGAGWSAG